jgi:hypothetical protein
LLFLGVCKIKIARYRLHYKQTYWMLRAELFQWCQSKRWLFNVSYHLWLNVLKHVLYTPTNSVIWHNDFQNLFFIFLAKHNIYNFTAFW